MARPASAAGVIVVRGGAVLLVRPTYKPHWDVPGGYVEPGESPLAACRREVREELGIEAGALSLAGVDWAPDDADGDRLLFLFAAPELAGLDCSTVEFPDGELSAAEFVPLDALSARAGARLTRRLTSTAHALRAGTAPVYLEHGLPPDASEAAH
jgi:ADP-ribose pyrophosphatase YjhB (NUDIX family)